MLAPLSAESIRLIEVRGGLGAVPGVRLAGVARRDQEAQVRPGADRARGPARVRRGRHDQRDQGGAAGRVDQPSRIRRRADGRDRRELRLRQRLHGRARPARRARDGAPSGDAARAAADASRRRFDRRDRRVSADGPPLEGPRTRGQSARARTRSVLRCGRSDHDDRSRAEDGRVRVARGRAVATSSAASPRVRA